MNGISIRYTNIREGRDGSDCVVERHCVRRDITVNHGSLECEIENILGDRTGIHHFFGHLVIRQNSDFTIREVCTQTQWCHVHRI